MQPTDAVAPNILLAQESVEQDKEPGYWKIKWRLSNIGLTPIFILEGRLPHGQFKSENIVFEPAIELAPAERRQILTQVRCNEPAGSVIENAFLIFHVRWLDDSWRIFARLSVRISKAGEPAARTVLVTTQRAGFSGVAT